MSGAHHVIIAMRGGDIVVIGKYGAASLILKGGGHAQWLEIMSHLESMGFVPADNSRIAERENDDAHDN
jgi:hypothetical protein